MKFSEILTISGLSGLHKMEGQRDNGLIVVALSGGKRQFVSSRKYMFTPLENITIYTDDDSVELKEVLLKMTEHGKVIEAKSSGDDLRAYFTEIVPNHDKEKVYNSDIKKMIKWYNELKEFDLLPKKSDEKKEKDSSEEKGKKSSLDSKGKNIAKNKSKQSVKQNKPKSNTQKKSTQIKASGRGK